MRTKKFIFLKCIFLLYFEDDFLKRYLHQDSESSHKVASALNNTNIKNNSQHNKQQSKKLNKKTKFLLISGVLGFSLYVFIKYSEKDNNDLRVSFILF